MTKVSVCVGLSALVVLGCGPPALRSAAPAPSAGDDPTLPLGPTSRADAAAPEAVASGTVPTPGAAAERAVGAVDTRASADAPASASDAGAAAFLPLLPNDRPMRFGTDQDGKARMFGDLDRVRLHARALSAQEIADEAARRYSACDQQRGCTAEWTFDALEGGAFPSSGPARLPAKLVGAGELVPGVEGMAVRLGGGYLQIENDRALASTAALTYSAWVRVPATCPVADGCTRARWIDKGPWFSLEAVRGHAHLQMSFQNLGPFKSQMGIPKGDVWTHVAVTYEATAIKFYVDGKLNRSHLPGGVQFNLKPNPSPLRLGAKQSTTPGDFYEGDLDLVRLYRRALAAEEVAAEARQQYAPCAKATACVVEWTFDDAEGARAPSSGGAALIGQLAGGYEIVDGLVGKALRLRRGWMDVPPDPALDFGDAFTFSAWLRRGPACPADRPDKCYLERLFGKGGSLIGEIREGNWRVIIDDKFMLSPSNSGAPPGRWAHLAIAFDHRDGLKIYLDGKLVRGWGVGKPDNLCYNCPGNPS